MERNETVPKGDNVARQLVSDNELSAQGLRACLAQMHDEATVHGFKFCAVHLKVAILELEEVILSQTRHMAQSAPSAVTSIVTIKSRAKTTRKTHPD